jgi:hypothetical protein
MINKISEQRSKSGTPDIFGHTEVRAKQSCDRFLNEATEQALFFTWVGRSAYFDSDKRVHLCSKSRGVPTYLAVNVFDNK